MERYAKDFLHKLEGFNIEVLEESKYSIYALSKELKFIYFNPAWYNFAIKNNINKMSSKRITLGASILNSIKGIRLKLFFRKNYKRVIRTGVVWHYQYECSSIAEYRFYHQSVYPLKNKAGILIVNTEMFKLPMDKMNRETYHVIEERYVQSDGNIVQCSNCRHSQRADQPEIWDWVPDWVTKLPIKYRLAICNTCDHLYKDSLPPVNYKLRNE